MVGLHGFRTSSPSNRSKSLVLWVTMTMLGGQGRGSDEDIAHRGGVRHVQRRGQSRHSGVDRQDPLIEGLVHIAVEPNSAERRPRPGDEVRPAAHRARVPGSWLPICRRDRSRLGSPMKRRRDPPSRIRSCGFRRRQRVSSRYISRRLRATPCHRVSGTRCRCRRYRGSAQQVVIDPTSS